MTPRPSLDFIATPRHLEIRPLFEQLLSFAHPAFPGKTPNLCGTRVAASGRTDIFNTRRPIYLYHSL
jgi:hypothetical protein